MDSYTAECLARDMAGADCDPPCPYCGGYPDRPVEAIPWDVLAYVNSYLENQYIPWAHPMYETRDALRAWLEANRPQEGA
jgi:hypothetical protein